MSIVRTKREAAKLSQEQLARNAGMSVYKLVRIEAERQTLRVSDAIALATALHCHVLDLLPDLRNVLYNGTPTRPRSEEVPADAD